MRQKFRYYWTLVILLSLVLSSFAYATAGNFCGGTSPCLCGSNCNNRGYEDFNDYNTINGHLVSGCKDGAEYAYEYTHEINVTDLERTTFSEGDEIKIVATSYCDSSGDYVNFIYYNGTAWKTLNTSLCNNAGLNNIEFNHTLDQVVGNHTIRIATFWSEETTIDCAQSAVCGFTCEAVYSDTDDVTFYVQSRETDNPIVNSILPSPGSSYNFLQDYQINISANVSDANELTYVRANVTWENGNKVINMSRDSGIYKGNFTDEIYLGRYNVTILARDTFGNLNNTENTYFILNTTTNITIYSPLENHYYDNSNINLNFEVYDTYDLDSVRYKFNSEDIQKSDFGIGVINNESATKSINDSVYINLSQSFNYTEQLEVRRLQFSLKKTGTINDINFKIRTDNNGPGNVIANGSVKSDKIQNSFSFVTAFLNASTTFQGNETYWISLESSGTDTDYIEWQVNEDGYDRGNSYYNNTNNLTYDFLFRIQHENKFNKSIDISNGRNNLTIYKNNTLGVEQSKIIYFTIDPTSPYISYVNYTKNVELGFNQSFKIDVSDYYSNVESALLEIQSRNYSMDTENSTTFTKGFATNMTGNITFRFYINDSAGNWNISDEYSFIVEDTMPPEFLNLSINPYLPDDIDPNVTINLTLNITDHSNLSSVILQFMDIGVWSSFEMVNNTLYYGNFTPNTTAVWTYRIFANDSFGNYNYSNNYTINVSFDTSWQIIPDLLILNVKL